MGPYPADRPAFPPDSPDPGNLAKRDEKPRSRRLPPYRVVLQHNADNDLMFIVRTVMELTRFCRAEATHKMWEAHHSGRSVLLVTHKERAELFVEQFASKGLLVSIEPAA